MNTIKFLGTAGARFSVIHQFRNSGGIWITLDDTNLLIDPGPGSLVRCLKSRPPKKPSTLDAILLTHRHIDHANDINIMIEAMTNGGYNKRGVLYTTDDALDDDPVVLHHFRNHLDTIYHFSEKETYQIKNITVETPLKHNHGVETYGLNIKGKTETISLIADTKYMPELEKVYTGEILILNVVLMESKPNILHLSLKDAEHIIESLQPKLSILTHFGMSILKNNPRALVEAMSKRLNLPILAASDGMQLNLSEILNQNKSK